METTNWSKALVAMAVLAGCGTGAVDTTSVDGSGEDLRRVRCGDRRCHPSEGCSSCPADCGACPQPACVPEADATFCARMGRTCGELSEADNCGSPRTVDCGACPTGRLEVAQARGAVDLSGDLSEFAGAAPVQVSAGTASVTFRLLWDYSYLYVSAAVVDADLRASGRGEDGSAWEDDSVEILLDPQHTRAAAPDATYRHVIVNARGDKYDASGAAGVGDSGYDVPGLAWAAAADGTFDDALADVGYRLAVRIPWSSLPLAASQAVGAGLVLGADLALNNRDASGATFGDWAQLRDFSTPSLWKELVLAPGPASCAPEADAALCSRLGKSCGSVSARDSCGAQRTIDCGACASPQTCGGGGVPNVCGAPPPVPASDVGTGTSFGPSYLTNVTGGGRMPDWTSNVVNAADFGAKGDGVTDDTGALQNAANAAAAQGKPLVVPATAAYYRTTRQIDIHGSVGGIDGRPTIKNVSGGRFDDGTVLRLTAGMTGWIYNLHLVGSFNGSTSQAGEWAHSINVGPVNGLTIKGNILENPMGDAIGTDYTRFGGGTTRSENVLVDGNTIRNPWRCGIALAWISDRWVITNNLIIKPVWYVTAVDYEPEVGGTITNVELAYNKFVMDPMADAGHYSDGFTVSVWTLANPSGGNLYNHHNYGSFGKGFFNPGGNWFNVVNADNVAGPNPP